MPEPVYALIFDLRANGKIGREVELAADFEHDRIWNEVRADQMQLAQANFGVHSDDRRLAG